MLVQTYNKKQNDSINTQNHGKKNFDFFLSEYIRMKIKVQKSIVLKRNIKKFDDQLITYDKKDDK